MENDINEGKRGFAIHRIPTQSFAANEIDLLLKLLAYNLFERFKHQCCEPIHQSYTVQRFRREFFCFAGVLVCHARQMTLKLSTSFPNKGLGGGWSKKVFYWNESIIPTYVLEMLVPLHVGRGKMAPFFSPRGSTDKFLLHNWRLSSDSSCLKCFDLKGGLLNFFFLISQMNLPGS